jgi:uncharacterized protein (TIGR02099 family)
MHREIDIVEQQPVPREQRWRRAVRVVGWSVVGIYFVAALGVLGLRFLVLPNVNRYVDTIAAAATRALGTRVEIDAVAAEWHGLHPQLELDGVRVYDRDGREALRLPHVGVTVAWRSLLYGRAVPRSLVVEGADLQVRRDARGRIFVAGLELQPVDAGDRGAAEAVLDIRRLVIRDASVAWSDELRKAPPLTLSAVQFVLENDGRVHRFALAAEPPRDQAAPLDVRGELLGRDLDQLKQWDGRVYAAFDYIDLSVWSAWIDLPMQIAGGRGALRVWATLRDWEPKDVLADVSLADVSMRLGADLPPLELERVEGRLGARTVSEGFEFMNLLRKRDVAVEAFVSQLAIETTAGVRFEPASFHARWQAPGRNAPEQGTFTATSIDLAPLARIAASLPLPQQVRGLLADLAPEGRLEDVRLAWTGDAASPRTYAARTRFSGLGMQAWGRVPGFARLDGQAELNEKGGSVIVDAQDVTLDFPAVLLQPRHQFDALSAKAAWTLAPERVEVRLDNLSLANADLAAVLSGSFHTAPDTAGYIDLTARVPRVAGPAVHRYLPQRAAMAAAWLKRGLVAGQGTEGRVRLKGNLRDFPFDDPKAGSFEVAVKVGNAVLEFDDAWPRLTGIHGEYTMNGRAVMVKAGRSATQGVALDRVTAAIPDLFAHPTLLKIDGSAEGAAPDFLRYVQASPLRRMTDQAFDTWTAAGNLRLALALELPLEELERSRVNGQVLLAGNTVTPGAAEAMLAQVNGRIDFTESTVSARGITAQWVGGPVTLDASTRAGATTVFAQGTANVQSVLAHLGVPLARRFTGSSPFRFTFTTRAGQQTQLIESQLQEVAIDLPPPFAKRAGEAWPLRIERTLPQAGGPQLVDVALAKVLNGRLQLRTDGAALAVERAGIGVGEVGVPLPDRPGVFVSVNLRTLDLDRFLALHAEDTAGTPAFQIAAVSIRAPEVIVAGKLFHDVQARALQAQPSRWQVSVNAREVSGEVSYASDGKGAVVAKLKHLVHPAAAPGGAEIAGRQTIESLPAIELVADRYLSHERDLGRLEVRAVNERRGWRVERLSLASPDCSLEANGLWQPAEAAAPARTSFSFDIEAANAGRCLTRLGYPETVTGGATRLDGEAQWRGPVYAIDYPTLTGKLKLAVERGQFVKVNPGMGKLLGVLSLQSLPRRISLDFRDVFSDGFAFDTIRGTAVISAGVLRTDDLAMAGPAANVSMKGEADLARETQDLTVRVVPVVGDSLAAAAGVALLNPIIGAGALLAQRILRDPIGQMFAFEYRVSGGWEDPRVERLAGRGATESETSPR